MVTTFPYRGAGDLRRMQALATRLWSESSYWHAGGLAWARSQHLGREPEWPTRLWGEPERIDAWAWLHLPGHLELQLDPDRPQLAPEILAWFEATATAESLSVLVPDGHDALRIALLAQGYAPGDDDEPFWLDLRHDLRDPATPSLPPGYRIRAVERGETARRAAVHRAAWERSRVSSQSYRTVMETWPYRRDLDLVVVDPEGELAASCLAWLEPDTASGELEPVGTDPRFRGRGLAAAVCLAALARLSGLGAREAMLHPRGDEGHPLPRRLYERLGFRAVNRTRTYRKEREPEAA